MGIHLDLNSSVIRVAPMLDDIEGVLRVYTRKHGAEADGVVRQISTHQKSRRRLALPWAVTERGEYETSIYGVPNDEGSQEFETRTHYQAGGVGAAVLSHHRRVGLLTRWYGGGRYLELRLRCHPGAAITLNRGLASLHGGGSDLVTQTRGGAWVEVHLDNHAHVGSALTLHPTVDDFRTWTAGRLASEPPEELTRFDRILRR